MMYIVLCGNCCAQRLRMFLTGMGNLLVANPTGMGLGKNLNPTWVMGFLMGTIYTHGYGFGLAKPSRFVSIAISTLPLATPGKPNLQRRQCVVAVSRASAVRLMRDLSPAKASPNVRYTLIFQVANIK